MNFVYKNEIFEKLKIVMESPLIPKKEKEKFKEFAIFYQICLIFKAGIVTLYQRKGLFTSMNVQEMKVYWELDLNKAINNTLKRVFEKDRRFKDNNLNQLKYVFDYYRKNGNLPQNVQIISNVDEKKSVFFELLSQRLYCERFVVLDCFLL